MGVSCVIVAVIVLEEFVSLFFTQSDHGGQASRLLNRMVHQLV